MSGINKVILVGNLGQDPEIRYTQDGKGITNFSIATSEEWKDAATGEKRSRTEWHRVVVFGKLAEICAEYLSKGRQVYIEGKLQTRKWQGQDGQDRYTTEVVVDVRGTMQMLGNREGSGQPQGQPQGQPRQNRQQENRPQGGQGGGQGGYQGQGYADDPGYDPSQGADDIPF